MAFTNSEIFSLCRYIVSKESLSGYMNIDDFNLNLKIANVLLLKEKLGLSNDFQLGVPLSKQHKGSSISHDDQIRQFKTKASIPFSSGIGSLPETYFKYNDLRVVGALEPVEVLTSSELSKRIGNAVDEPDILFPAAEIIGSSVYIYPTTITSASMVYYRYPQTCALSYYIDENGEIVPMAAGATHLLASGETGMNGETSGTTVTSTTIEHQWSEDCGIELAWIILRNMGLNLSRTDIFQVASVINKEGI